MDEYFLFPSSFDFLETAKPRTIKSICVYIYIYIGGWGVLPTGKSISVSVALALRACVRAKLCAGA